MRLLLLTFVGLMLSAVLVFDGFVRLAPIGPARWHVDLSTARRSPKPNDAVAAPAGGDLVVPVFAELPAALAARLDAIALAEPRTLRIAGSPAEGRMTYVQRSALWGFPDVITAEAIAVDGGATLKLWSRARFGYSDLGVNRARLERWLAALAP